MSATRSRLLALPVAAALALGAIVGAERAGHRPRTVPRPPSTSSSTRSRAATSSALGEVVCAADRRPCSDAFDIRAQLGLESGDPLIGAAHLRDRRPLRRGSSARTATRPRCAVTATMSMSVAEDQIEDLVRAILEADHGPGRPAAQR